MRRIRLFEQLGRLLRHFWSKYLPNKPPDTEISETREKITPPIRETKTIQKAENVPIESAKTPDTFPCPYCSSKNTVRRGIRKKKYETQQRYLCNDCQRSFVPQKIKGKSFPLSIILEGLSLYNTGFTLEESCQKLKERFGIEVKPSTLSDWAKDDCEQVEITAAIAIKKIAFGNNLIQFSSSAFSEGLGRS